MNLFTFKLLVILYLIMVVSYYIIGVINIAKRVHLVSQTRKRGQMRSAYLPCSCVSLRFE